ncbi:hypothetical protein MNBD_NITROSPINAE04-560 [hydrothermal vent metagenome]|uniref:FlgO domain-containing protein n=1 Tax=hydrothermal vent metagenome TaxID=652676 RepID=A0A3B1BIT3_9ZZZZ
MFIKYVVLLTSITLMFTACAHYEREPGFQRELSWIPYAADQSGPAQKDSWPPRPAIYTQRFVWKMRYLADKLAEAARVKAPGKTNTLVTTIVPVEDINRPTGFGRLCSEQLMTELAGFGFNVIEARKTKDFWILDNEGEFSLSRDITLLSEQFNADMALVGTYVKSGSQVLLNVRLVDADGSGVLAAASAMMDLRGDKFLLPVFQNTKSDTDGPGMEARLTIRKKILADVDTYAEILQSMSRDMARKISEPLLSSNDDTTVAVATFVDVDNMYRAATFGRYMTEQVMAEIARMGYNVVELRVTPDFYVDVRIGELGLSREMSRLMNDKKVDAVVVGTYVRAADNVVVNARLVRGDTRRVAGASSMIVDASKKNKFVTAMLKNEITTIMPTETVEGY